MSGKYMLVFDIPRKKNALRNRVHRKLVKEGVKKLQGSVWVSENEELLVELAKEIKKCGAIARVMRFEEVF